jgi:hypothetical protein
MSRSNYRLLIDRGRKAGLNTRELYSAMTSASGEGSEFAPGQADGNGFVAAVDERGHRIYRPIITEKKP